MKSTKLLSNQIEKTMQMHRVVNSRLIVWATMISQYFYDLEPFYHISFFMSWSSARRLDHAKGHDMMCHTLCKSFWIILSMVHIIFYNVTTYPNIASSQDIANCHWLWLSHSIWGSWRLVHYITIQIFSKIIRALGVVPLLVQAVM